MAYVLARSPQFLSGFMMLARAGETALWIVRLLLVSTVYGMRYLLVPLLTPMPARQSIKARLMSDLLVRMGPLSIKLGQLLSTHLELLPPEMTKELQKLQDSVPACSNRYVRSKLEGALVLPLELVFERFDWTPVASASIAQVHDATLRTGQRVAVKIVKRNVRCELHAALNLVRLVILCVHLFSPAVRQQRLAAHFAQVDKLLRAQTDLLIEAANQKGMRDNFEGHPYVLIPEPYPALCSRDVLVMEYMDGIRGIEAHRVGLDRKLLARRLQHAFYTMAYQHGCFHADPHPGNILFTLDGNIIFLDFGIVGSLTEEEKWGLSSFYYAATRRDWDLAIARFTRYFVIGVSPATRSDLLANALRPLLQQHFDERRDRWSTMMFAKQANQVLRHFQLRLTSSFTTLMLGFVSGEGFVAAVDPDIDVWDNARQFTDRASPYMSDESRQGFDRWFAEAMPGSLQWRARAANSLVAPTHLDRYMMPSVYPIFVQHAHGCMLHDVDGNTFIDLASGFGPHILGYGHEVVRQALLGAAESGGVNAISHMGEVLLAEALIDAFPSAQQVIFTNSGTEALLQAIRLCRASRGRRRIAKFEGHYHGFSDHGMVSSWFRFSGPLGSPEPFFDMPGADTRAIDDMLILQYGDEQSIRRIADNGDQLCCVVCEPMPSALASYDAAFLASLRTVCSQYGIPLVFDEVVTGFRVAFGGVQTLLGIEPDLTCLGKIIGGGLPCAAVIGRRELVGLAKSSADPFVDAESKVFVGSTLSGNAYSCATGLATINYLREHPEVYTTLARHTQRLVTELEAIAHGRGIPLKVAGTGSILSITFGYRNARHIRTRQAGTDYRASLALAYYMRKRGVYVPELHTMLLSAALEDNDITTVISAFDGCLADMSADGFFRF